MLPLSMPHWVGLNLLRKIDVSIGVKKANVTQNEKINVSLPENQKNVDVKRQVYVEFKRGKGFTRLALTAENSEIRSLSQNYG